MQKPGKNREAGKTEKHWRERSREAGTSRTAKTKKWKNTQKKSKEKQRKAKKSKEKQRTTEAQTNKIITQSRKIIPQTNNHQIETILKV